MLGDYIADLRVEEALIVELKTARSLTQEHAAQILAYLKSTRMEHGLLTNFGAYRFEIRKFALKPVSFPFRLRKISLRSLRSLRLLHLLALRARDERVAAYRYCFHERPHGQARAQS